MTSTGTGPSAKTRVDLLRAVREDLAEFGELKPERAARRAGRSPASFYVYFPSKLDALVAAFDRCLDDLVSSAVADLDLEDLIVGGVGSVVESFVSTTIERFAADQLVMRAGFAVLSTSSDARESFRRWEDHALAEVARFVELAQEIGRVRAGDPVELAGGWLVLAQGLNNPRLLALGRHSPECRLVEQAMVTMLEPAPQVRVD